MRILTAEDECDTILTPWKDGKQPGSIFKRFTPTDGGIVSIKKVSNKDGKVCNNFFTVYKLKLEAINNFGNKRFFELLLILSGDIHPNPGPQTRNISKKLLIGTYNVRGASDRNKIRRLINYAYSKMKDVDRFIYSFQETHITDKRYSEIKYLWREEFVIAPGKTNARGVLTLYNKSCFDNLLYQFSDPLGRSTWIAGSYEGQNDLFVSVYAPNNGLNAEYYKSLFNELDIVCKRFDIDNIYLSGDLNIDLLGHSKNGKNGSRILKTVNKELRNLKLQITTDKSTPIYYTWNHGNKFSTLDYVIVSDHIAKFVSKHNIMWGIDKSDHAAIEVTVDLNIVKGSGMFRPDSSFLDKPELANEFSNELSVLIDQIPQEWNPHDKLEFVKTSIRTLLGIFSKRYINNMNSQLYQTRNELNKLIMCKQKIVTGLFCNFSNSLSLDQLNPDIDRLQFKLDNLLAERSKYLSKRARVKWLELGEKSNKYFLNIINKNLYKMYINELFNPDNGEITKSNEDKLKIAYNFYADLYKIHDTSKSDTILSNIDIPVISETDWLPVKLDICNEDLTLAIRKCGNTASGPDGIGYKVLKSIWNIYSPFLIDSWHYGQITGSLTFSHRESVICLLDKKGKDRRHINNLRPISLSNCDIKIITKALTRKFTDILPKIIHPMQSAYISGRQVHDNVRLINLVKDYSSNDKKSPLLISLDAKKAFDSVSHKFISDVLIKYGVPAKFIDRFKLLYNNLQSRVLINGFTTNAFPLERSVKQGDALSCVLFDFCIDVLVRNIFNENKIVNIRINTFHIPKAIAYADDVAILTYPEGVQSVFDVYEQFSKASGLYLNADKTEIMNISPFNKINELRINYCNNLFIINTISSVKICGVTFSLDKSIEYQHNVSDKINNLDKALEGWRKRNLSIFGRNLILKTFGLSQLIYFMQNSYFSNESLKEINTICYQFIWNKKKDKNRAYERISRIKLQETKANGGISAPDIFSFNKSLKLHQFMRSLLSDNNHFIAEFQLDLIKNINCITNRKTRSEFINYALSSINEIGIEMIREISVDSELKLCKNYYNLIASCNLVDVLSFNKNNQIAIHYAKELRDSLNIVNVKQFIVEYKFPRTEEYIDKIKFIFNSETKLMNALYKRKFLEDDTLFTDYVLVDTNRFLDSRTVSTKALTNFFISKKNKTSKLRYTAESESEPVKMIYGLHPKENEMHLFYKHGVILSNQKLFKMKLTDSELCPICDVVQDTDHIFHGCSNARLIWSVLNKDFKFKFSESEFTFGVTDKTQNELLLLAKRLLFINKNKKLDKTFIVSLIQDRIADINSIIEKKRQSKKLAIRRKLILNA